MKFEKKTKQTYLFSCCVFCRFMSVDGTEQGWKVLKLVAVLYLAVLLGCTALINFSLGYILALTLVPVAAFVTPHVPQ